ncbi:MAG: restriction endonuclease subunit S, partial [Akkermansia sp.]|nr:restriction endonuclease subunit S [Akkermansia sp.]
LPKYAKQVDITHTLAKIQSIISHRRAQLAKLDELVKCRFVELFGDPVAPEKKWKVSTFGNEFEIFSGGTPSTGVSKYWDNGTIPWIGSNLCQDAILKHTDGKHITDDGFNNSSAKWAHAGYVLVALVGATIGKTALLTISTTTNQNIASINVPGNINYTSEYIYMLMRFLYTKFMELGNGGFKMANLGFIRQLPLLTPPISLQSEYSAFVRRIDKSRFVVKEGEKAVKTLKRLGLGVNEIDRAGKIW